MAPPGSVTQPSAVETATVWLVRDSRSYRAHAAWPLQGEEPSPGVLIVHDAAGLGDAEEDLARRLAGEGYMVIAPDLYSRGGSPDPGNAASVAAAPALLSDRQALDDLDAAVSWLLNQPRCSGSVGAVGLGMGGRLVLLLATDEDPVLDSAVDAGGGRITHRTMTVDLAHPDVPVDRVEHLHCPLLCLFGGDDQDPDAADIAELQAALERRGAEHRVVVYPGAARPLLGGERGEGDEASARGPGWDDTLAWLSRMREAAAAG